MLTLDSEGKPTTNPGCQPKIIYSAMLLRRAAVVFDTPHMTLSALKIALRFGASRKSIVKFSAKKTQRTMINCPSFHTAMTPLLAIGIS